MHKTSGCLSFLSYLMQVVLFAILGGVIGFFAGPIIIMLHNTGVFHSWQLLGNPNRINHIIGTKYYTGILVQTDDGKYFAYYNDFGKANGECGSISDQCEVWIEVKSPSVSSIYNRWDKWWQGSKTDCSYQNTDSWDPALLPPPLWKASKPIECAFTFFRSDYSGGSASYILLDNGELWMYQVEIEIFDSLGYFFVPILFGVFAGAFVGMIRLARNS